MDVVYCMATFSLQRRGGPERGGERIGPRSEEGLLFSMFLADNLFDYFVIRCFLILLGPFWDEESITLASKIESSTYLCLVSLFVMPWGVRGSAWE